MYNYINNNNKREGNLKKKKTCDYHFYKDGLVFLSFELNIIYFNGKGIVLDKP